MSEIVTVLIQLKSTQVYVVLLNFIWNGLLFKNTVLNVKLFHE